MLNKLNTLKNWQAAVIFAIIGFAVFSIGLNSPFQGDDLFQIVNNPPVHSISNIVTFFEGGTFYKGNGGTSLGGIYYRPLMTTVFSVLYTLFGPHPIYFHLLQLCLCIGSAVFLYLFLAYFVRKPLALLASLVFLVHPISSQVVYAIPSMQDALFFFFGIISLWILMKYSSSRSLLLVAACLTLSIFAKETGVLFSVLALLLMLMRNRPRKLYLLLLFFLPLAIIYLVLRVHAIGFFGANPKNAPIDNLSLSGRLMTIPSMVLFYLSKFIFPWRLASAYYFTHPHYSFKHFLIPLLIDLIVLTAIVFGGFIVKRKSTLKNFRMYLFFAVWFVLGLAIHLQVFPLDMTVSETWFYFPMAGLLGLITIFASSIKLKIRLNKNTVLIFCSLIVLLLGLRSVVRGDDWNNTVRLAYKDIYASPTDYNAYNNISQNLIARKHYALAASYAQHSVSIMPAFSNYNNLGVALTYLGDYGSALKAYNHALRFGNDQDIIYENRDVLTLVYGNVPEDDQIVNNAIRLYPYDPKLWMYSALYAEKHNLNAAAKLCIANAVNYGAIPQFIHYNIVNNRPFQVYVPQLNRTIQFQ